MGRALGGFILQPDAHPVSVDLLQRKRQQRAQDARQRLVTLAGSAPLGAVLPSFLAHGRMVSDMALTPPRGARCKVGLPGVECRRCDALRLDTLRLCFGTLRFCFNDAVALLLARVDALVNHRLQPARFVACG
jgi:hypothetical protein